MVAKADSLTEPYFGIQFSSWAGTNPVPAAKERYVKDPDSGSSTREDSGSITTPHA